MVKEKLSNLYDIGSSKRVFQSEWREEGVPFYRAREIARLSEDGYVDNELFIDEDLYEEYTEKYGKPQPGDVMVTGVGTLGVCYVVKPEDKFYFKDGNILWFKQKAPERILPEYLVKAFDSKDVKDFISKNSSGTTVGTFTIQTANKMEISLPTLIQQKEIIERISKLEGIIKKRQLEIEKLDELIKARFIEMFGDPTYNPNSYPIVQLSNYIEFLTSGSRGWARYCVDDGKEWFITIKNVKDCNIITDNMQTINAPDNAEAKRTKVKEGDLLISITADLGRTGVVTRDISEHGAYINQHLICIRLKTELLEPLYVAHYLESPAGKIQFASKNQSAVKAGLNFNSINSLKLLLPPKELQCEFISFINQVNKSKIAVQKALDETQMLFDSLMQKYFG